MSVEGLSLRRRRGLQQRPIVEVNSSSFLLIALHKFGKSLCQPCPASDLSRQRQTCPASLLFTINVNFGGEGTSLLGLRSRKAKGKGEKKNYNFEISSDNYAVVSILISSSNNHGSVTSFSSQDTN